MCYKQCSVFAVFSLVFQLSQPVVGLWDCVSIIERLEHEEWTGEEASCKDATLELMHGVRNSTLWASWIWDSMQPPIGALSGSRYHLGNFDQCLGAPWNQPWTSQYCLVEFKLTEESRPYDGEVKDPFGNVEEFVGMRSQHNRNLQSYSLGVCLPSVCSAASVAKISRHLHQLTHLPLADVIVDPSFCQVKEERPYGLGFYCFWMIIAVMALICGIVYFIEDHLEHPKLLEMASWFSPTQNFEALIRATPGELSSLNGIRGICAGIAVIMHYFYYVAAPAAVNAADIGKDMDTTAGKFAIQLALVIDSFFVLSGLLHMKGMMANSAEPIKTLLKRYLRLLAPFAMSILYMTAVLQHTISGPLWPKMMKEQTETCERNWWLSLLMMNNYIRNEAICHTVTWYLSCDYQLTILGTVLFCACKKMSRKTAIQFISAAFAVSMLIPAALTYWNESPAVFLYDIEDAGDVKLNAMFLITYMKSHSRASAYMIGLGLGYLVHLYKPKDYRKTINKHASILGGVLGIFLLGSVMGVGGMLVARPYDVLEATAYSMLDRSVWAVGICCLIVVTEYGTFPIVGDLLSSKVFLSLCRLSYISYLFHPALLHKIFYSTRTSVTYSFFHHLLDSFGYISVSSLGSYLFWFIIEAPMSNMINSLFRNRSKKTKKQEESTQDASIAHENGKINGTIMFDNGLQNRTDKANGIQNGTLTKISNVVQNGVTHVGNGTKKPFVNGSLNHNGNVLVNGKPNGSIKCNEFVQGYGGENKKDM